MSPRFGWFRSTLVLLGLCLLGTSCGGRRVTVAIRSLEASGDVTYVCRLHEDGRGAPLSDCSPAALSRGDHDLFALVTQTSTGEVAVINVALSPSSAHSDEGVVDVDPWSPGFGFLRIGARPGDIVTTPGGEASFVAVGEPGKEGIFALPTRCLGAPEEGESARDLTTWAACRLPATPGEMTVALDPPRDGVVAESCDSAEAENLDPVAALRAECPANLTQEGGGLGRRKLLVALPDRGSLVVIDAQSILDQPPGSFGACAIEREIDLSVDLPPTPIAQVLPPDLVDACVPAPVPVAPPPASFFPRPAGFARAEDTLYIADREAPVVHAVDLSGPCDPFEEPPLLPQSYSNSARVVTTSRLSVSPVTPQGRRFVYAIDEEDFPTASLMIFDVSPDSGERTPILRPGTALLPSEAPDRIQFSASVKDVSFVLRDRPAFDDSGATPIGLSCEPDPALSDSLGAEYRPTETLTGGARASELRGVFAMALLTSGQVIVVDTEDFDAPCRRPVATNPGSEPDFRGCQDDPPDLAAYALADGTPTVTDEVSCRVVEPHRARTSRLAVTRSSLGVGAPGLRAFPQLSVPSTAAQLSEQERPKLLGVDFDPLAEGGDPVPARVYVGASEHVNDPDGDLVLDPRFSDQHSVVLPFVEPRAYAPSNSWSLAYEAAITGQYPSGFLEPGPNQTLMLRDPGAAYCDGGIEDVRLMMERGSERFGLLGDELDRFGRAHADTIVIEGDFPDRDDAYWKGFGMSCGRAACLSAFGDFEETDLPATREFRVLEAEQQRLLLEPKQPRDANEGAALVELAECCFPSGTPYRARAASQWVLASTQTGFRHDIVARAVTTDAGETIFQCQHDCHPRKRYFQSRVFEIVSSCEPPPGDLDACSVGRADADEGALCTIDELEGGVVPGEPAAACIHDTPTARFAVYRGLAPSQRDMRFTWETLGGFTPMAFNLRGLSSFVSPQVLVPLPETDRLSVVDAASLGLVLLSLDRLSVLSPTFN